MSRILETPVRNVFSPTSRAPVWLLVGIVLALQAGALIWMLAGRISLLSSGREMIVEVVPVDPRDLFRGDYVILGYTFSGTGEMTLPAGTTRGDRLYATLKAGEGSKWELVSVANRYPDTVGTGHAVLSGYASDVWPNRELGVVKGRIRYGIEQYYVPEGTGGALEQQVRDKKIEAVLAVSASGEAAIKALMVDGKRVYEEPLF